MKIWVGWFWICNAYISINNTFVSLKREKKYEVFSGFSGLRCEMQIWSPSGDISAQNKWCVFDVCGHVIVIAWPPVGWHVDNYCCSCPCVQRLCGAPIVACPNQKFILLNVKVDDLYAWKINRKKERASTLTSHLTKHQQWHIKQEIKCEIMLQKKIALPGETHNIFTHTLSFYGSIWSVCVKMLRIKKMHKMHL